ADKAGLDCETGHPNPAAPCATCFPCEDARSHGAYGRNRSLDPRGSFRTEGPVVPLLKMDVASLVCGNGGSATGTERPPSTSDPTPLFRRLRGHCDSSS